MVHPRFLGTMRATQEAALPDTCDVVRVALATDELGGVTPTRTTIATVPCRVGPGPSIREAEGVRNEQVVATNDWAITMPYGTEIDETHEVEWNEGGRTFQVTSVQDGSLATATNVIATETV